MPNTSAKVRRFSIRVSLNAFADFMPRAVAYNALLQGWFGQLWPSAHTLDAAHVQHGIMQGDFGVTGNLRFGSNQAHRLTVTRELEAFRTPEFVSPLLRSHHWGGWFITFGW